MKKLNHRQGSPAFRAPRAVAITLAALALILAAAGLRDGVSEAGSGHTRLASLSGNYLAGRQASRARNNQRAADFYERALREDPDNAYILQSAFLLEVAAGRIERAQHLARRLVKQERANAFARLVLGLGDFRSGRYARARRHFEAAAQGSVAKLTSRLLIAWTHLAAGAPQKALESLSSLDATESFRVFRAYHSALIADLAGLRQRALAHYKQAYADAGSSLRVVQAYGRFLERTGRVDEARAIYAKFQESAPQHPLIKLAVARSESGRRPARLVASPEAGMAEVLFGIASALADETGIDLALRYAQLAIHMHPAFPVANMLLGGIYEDIKDHAKAVETYGKVPDRSPLKPNADLQIAENLEKLGKSEEAVAHLRTVIASRPQEIQPHILLGNILRARSSFAEAAEAYSRAVELIEKPEQRHWTLFYFRGISYERTKQWPRAEADFKMALKLNPDQPSVLNYLGYSWVEQRSNLRRALEMIRTAVDLRRNDGYIVDSLGWAHYQLGDYDEAVTQLERAVELRPDDPIINDHLGDGYWRVGRRREARFQWTYARDLGPEPDHLKKIEKKLEHGLEEPKKKVVAAREQTTVTDAPSAPAPGEAEDRSAKTEEPEDAGPAEPPESDGELRLHRIAPGESLWDISKRYFGKGSAFIRIMNANQEIRDPDLIYPGQQIVIPDSD